MNVRIIRKEKINELKKKSSRKKRVIFMNGNKRVYGIIRDDIKISELTQEDYNSLKTLQRKLRETNRSLNWFNNL